MDAVTMREFDALCLSPMQAYSGPELKALRERLHVSQPVLAMYLGVTKSTVAQWEQGAKKPRGPALRLLNLADRKGLDAIA
jgi:putative transcriptional regulator